MSALRPELAVWRARRRAHYRAEDRAAARAYDERQDSVSLRPESRWALAFRLREERDTENETLDETPS